MEPDKIRCEDELTYMRLASLDLGTNALLLTIARWDGSELVPLYEDALLIRLGQEVVERGSLHPDAKTRCLEAVRIHRDIIVGHEVDKTIAVGTEALRKAHDGEAFLKDIHKRYGIRFAIISAEQEAILTFKATQKEFASLDRNLLMFDIGGGSTEIVSGDSQTISSISSLPLGTVTVTDQFLQHDPVTESEIAAACRFVRSKLNSIALDRKNRAGVGVGGTVTTLKAVTLRMEAYDHSAIHRSILSRLEVDDLVKLFSSLTTKQRLALKGLPEKRADIISAGTLITQIIMDAVSLKEIYVSDRGLRWGVLYDWIEKQKMA